MSNDTNGTSEFWIKLQAFESCGFKVEEKGIAVIEL